jgi:single-stranded DNA-binding protein
VWGKSGENFASLANEGQEVIIEAQLRRNDWDSAELHQRLQKSEPQRQPHFLIGAEINR